MTRITVGGDALTSSSNTFAGVVTGLDVTLQVGGSDQWGNMTAGTDLVRRMSGGAAAHALVLALVLVLFLAVYFRFFAGRVDEEA